MGGDYIESAGLRERFEQGFHQPWASATRRRRLDIQQGRVPNIRPVTRHFYGDVALAPASSIPVISMPVRFGDAMSSRRRRFSAGSPANKVENPKL